MSADTGQTRHSVPDTSAGACQERSENRRSSIEQVIFSLEHPIDSDAMYKAWLKLLEQHPQLLSASDDDANEQATSSRHGFEVVDWRGEVDEAGRQARLEAFLRSTRRDQATGAPAFRLLLARWDERSWRCICVLPGELLDWRSLSVILRELIAHYFAAVHGVSPPSQGMRLVTNFRSWLDAESSRNVDPEFWREYLDGLPLPCSMDLLPPEGERAEPLDACVERTLDSARSDSVRRLRKAADVTMNNLVEAAWGLLLSRYQASTSILFGIVRSCRHSLPPGVDDALGSFVNTVPLRLDVEREANVFELLWQARDQHRRVREHECSPLEGIAASLPGTPGELFDTVLEFDLRDPMRSLAEVFGDTGPYDFQHHSSTSWRLHLQVYGEDEIVVRLRYRPDLVDRATVVRIVDQFCDLVVAMAREPWMPVKDVPFLSDDDIAPCRWPGVQRLRACGKARTIHGMFEDQVRHAPDAVALSFGEECVTYGELNRRANRLAHELRRNGVQPDQLVGLCTERGIDQIVGILGILKSGAGYLPLDPAYPGERLKFMVEDAGVRFVLSTDQARSRIPAGNHRILPIHAEGRPGDDENPVPRGGADDLAYVIYTSGSTGKPKGVMVEHRNVVRLFDACESWLNAGIGDVWTMFHSFAFDFSVWEIWGALLHGGRLEIVPLNVARSPDAFHDLLVERGVTVLNQTPSAFRQLSKVNDERDEKLPALRLVVFGGEKLDFADLREWMERHGDERPRMVNMYGITETTVHVTYRPLLKKDVMEGSASCIGWPLPDLYVRLLDADGTPVPPGVRGELCVGGAGVTRGYLNRPQLTGERFVPDPMDPEARLYRSGDYARLLPNGELAYIGRQDDQVKISGFRIDLGEVVSALRDVPGIEQGTVLARGRTGEQRLVAYYVERDGAGLTVGKLRKALAERLPGHMIPAAFVAMDALPMNANNKIDTKSLPEPSSAPVAASPKAAPSESGQARGTDGDEAPHLLTPMQQWFFEQAFEEPDHWNQSRIFRVPPEADVDAIERALLSVVARHDALRMRFARDENDQWRCEPVKPEEAMEFSRIELDHLEERERREAMALITDDIQSSLSLSAGLLVRAAHFTGGLEEGDRLFIAIHQLGIDAASWQILLLELDAAYRAIRDGEEPESDAVVSMSDWVAELERHAHSTSAAGEQAYWEKVQESLADDAFERALENPGKEGNARTERIILDATDTSALQGDALRAYGTTTQELLLAALTEAVHRQWPATPRLRIDLLRHERGNDLAGVDLSQAVGWFSTLQPLSLELFRGGKPAALICATKESVRGAPHGGIGWGALRYLRGGYGGRKNQGRALILFDYAGAVGNVVDTRNFQEVAEPCGPDRSPSNRLAWPLSVKAVPRDDRLEITFRHDPDVLDVEEVRRLAGNFMHAIKSLLQHCRSRPKSSSPHADFPMARVTDQELAALRVPLEHVEDILPLSPTQQQVFATAGNRNQELAQRVFVLEGTIHEKHLLAAWKELVRRHDTLRTVFLTEGLAEPHQLVLDTVDFRMQSSDWRKLDEASREERLNAYLAAERRQGFEGGSPMIRVALIRLDDQRWALACTWHRALLDGSSWAILAEELGELHDAALEGRRASLEAAGSYRSYISWLAHRELDEYEQFWRRHLGAQPGTNRSLIIRSGEFRDETAQHTLELSVAHSEKITALARRLRLTPGVVFQAAWALLLSGLTRRFDVTLGVRFASRTSGLPVPRQTVGAFTNDLPVRVKVEPMERLDRWLAGLRTTQADVNHFQDVSINEIHEWIGLADGDCLFDSLVVFRNDRMTVPRRWGRNITLRDSMTDVPANYPVVVAVVTDSKYRIELHGRADGIDAPGMQSLASDLHTILRAIAEHPDVHVSTVMNHVTTLPGEIAADDPASHGETATDAHRDETERNINAGLAGIIARTCCEVLGLDEVDPASNFFDAGAQSVTLVEIHERLQKTLGRTFPVVKLFQHPSVESLAGYLQDDGNGQRATGAARRGAERRAAMMRRRQARQPGNLER